MNPADRFSSDPWERRVAELEQAVGDKSRRILQLEQDLARRDARLREAVTRLGEAEDAVDAQAQLVMLSSEGGTNAAPDALARVAAEKGVLESRERQLRGERDRLLAERTQRETLVQNLKGTIQQAKVAFEARDRRIVELESRVRAADAAHVMAVAEWRTQRERLLGEATDANERTKLSDLAREKVERSLLDATHQVDLYRKNLVQAEHDLGARDEELVVACEEQVRLQNEVRRQERQVAFVERQRDRLQERLEEETAWAEERHLQALRLSQRLRLANLVSSRDARTAHDDARAAEADRASLEKQRSALQVSVARLSASLHAQDQEFLATREALTVLESQLHATSILAKRGHVVALERAMAAFAASGVQPPDSIAAIPLATSQPGKVESLLRWLRRS